MNRKQLATEVARLLAADNIKKVFPTQRTTLHIEDDYGNKTDFVVKKERMQIRYTAEELDVILEACCNAIVDALKRGEDIKVNGFGHLRLKRVAPRVSPHPLTGELINVKEHYVVKFDSYKELKTAAAVYSAIDEEMQIRASGILSGINEAEPDEYEEQACEGE